MNTADPVFKAQEKLERAIFTLETTPKSGDSIDHPSYYTQWPLEPAIFLILNNVPFAESCVIRYVMRWREKGGIQDLKKAKRYIDMLIELDENKTDYIPKKTRL